MSTKLEKP